MKAKDLAEILLRHPEREVIVQLEDSSGTSYSPLAAAETDKYQPYSESYGDRGLEEMSPAAAAVGDRVMEGGQLALFLVSAATT